MLDRTHWSSFYHGPWRWTQSKALPMSINTRRIALSMGEAIDQSCVVVGEQLTVPAKSITCYQVEATRKDLGPDSWATQLNIVKKLVFAHLSLGIRFT